MAGEVVAMGEGRVGGKRAGTVRAAQLLSLAAQQVCMRCVTRVGVPCSCGRQAAQSEAHRLQEELVRAAEEAAACAAAEEAAAEARREAERAAAQARVEVPPGADPPTQVTRGGFAQ